MNRFQDVHSERLFLCWVEGDVTKNTEVHNYSSL